MSEKAEVVITLSVLGAIVGLHIFLLVWFVVSISAIKRLLRKLKADVETITRKSSSATPDGTISP